MRSLILLAAALLASCAKGDPPMAALPDPGDLHSLVVRTDFSSETTWSALRSALVAPQGDFRAMLTFVDDRRYEGLTIDSLVKMTHTDPNRTFVFVADSEAMAKSDHAVLVVDVRSNPWRTFRVVPSMMWSVQNNLYLANMDWEEFAEATGADGVFRGFPE